MSDLTDQGLPPDKTVSSRYKPQKKMGFEIYSKYPRQRMLVQFIN